ncbi:WecB/TagA/CpsF family glycosyltransferase [Paraburkholderia humisilvae]|uniref:N-acetylglucosaminyldiphosphoundecaprenol N-acetyl-beta-D-mannosaminyltransferase n=1 Tax=Paraburkholderia humisilvae TaxID=627669 RepID=A0A6J5DFL7_9BURK|nr:WecB/TagA/CpsF family glycosyltransferase [Paraburkholderia humisilvae]CAB3751952.1 N-acetylglucosaminyldiphosphoundecaprenol N-acetyl-beta-D-mannosaminyltransferase [Paraburkholderia humisilvae]
MQRIELFGCPMDSATMAETVAWIGQRIAARQFTQHVVVNVAKLVHLQTDVELAASVRACDIVNIDGMGVVWGARLLGHSVPERVAGIDLFNELLEHAVARDYPVFLLGGTADVVERTAAVCRERLTGLTLAGYHHGYFWDDEAAVVEAIRTSGARLLFVAITSPSKETFINRWKHELGVDFVMGVGGTFDVIAGKVRRAPRWMQRGGLEWLFRVLQEPRRMWRRYLRTNGRFALMLGKAWLTAPRD